jgi:hypothetical protein
MRDIIIPAVIVLVGIGGIALWLLNVGSVQPLHPSETVQTAEAPIANPNPPKNPKTASKTAKTLPLVTEQVTAAIPTNPPDLKPVVHRQPAQRPPLPAANQIVIGGERTWVTTNLGEPTLTATTSDGGHLRETLVYTRDQDRRVTIVVIDGKISSAF